MNRKIAGVIIGLCLIPSLAFAQQTTIESLQQQIAALLAQLANLQSQLLEQAADTPSNTSHTPGTFDIYWQSGTVDSGDSRQFKVDLGKYFNTSGSYQVTLECDKDKVLAVKKVSSTGCGTSEIGPLLNPSLISNPGLTDGSYSQSFRFTNLTNESQEAIIELLILDSSGNVVAKDSDSLKILSGDSPTEASINPFIANKGDRFDRGDRIVIGWNSKNIPSRNPIDIYISGPKNMTVVNNTRNDGSYSWTIPRTLPLGEYKFLVGSYDTNPLVEESTKTFIVGEQTATESISVDLKYDLDLKDDSSGFLELYIAGEPGNVRVSHWNYRINCSAGMRVFGTNNENQCYTLNGVRPGGDVTKDRAFFVVNVENTSEDRGYVQIKIDAYGSTGFLGTDTKTIYFSGVEDEVEVEDDDDDVNEGEEIDTSLFINWEDDVINSGEAEGAALQFSYEGSRVDYASIEFVCDNSEIDINYKTRDCGEEIRLDRSQYQPGVRYSLRFPVENLTNESQPLVAILNLYDSAGRMIKFGQKSLKVLANQSPTVEQTSGDINGDGSVTSYDASLVSSHVDGNRLHSSQQAFADVNDDGRITRLDARIILAHSIGIVSSLPDSSLQYGDVNFDGSVTSYDAALISGGSLSSKAQLVADVNDDGSINQTDAVMVNDYSIGLRNSLGVVSETHSSQFASAIEALGYSLSKLKNILSGR